MNDPNKDATGLSKAVTLDHTRMFVPKKNAVLEIFRADYSARGVFGTGSLGSINILPGGKFRVLFRPAQVGAPVMIQCALLGNGAGSHFSNAFSTSITVEIETWGDQGVAVVESVGIPVGEPLSLVLLPMELGWSGVEVRPETEANNGVTIDSCQLTPLS